MYNTIKTDLHSKPLAYKDIMLRNGQVWAFDLSREANDNLIIDIEFFSKYPVDIVLFPNRHEMNAHLKGSMADIMQTVHYLMLMKRT